MAFKLLEKPVVATGSGPNVNFFSTSNVMLHGGLIYEASLKPWAQWVTHFRNDWREIFKARGLKGSRQSSIFKGTALGVFQICLWGCQRLTNVFSAVPDGHMYCETVQSLQAEQLRKWPQLSPGNRPTHSRDASIECVVMAERGRLAVDRFGNTVAKATTRGAEGSCRQSADTLWVNPFKHDLLSSFFSPFFISLSAKRMPSLPRRKFSPFWMKGMWNYTMSRTLCLIWTA